MKEFSHPGVTEKTPIDLNHAIETTIAVSRNEWKYVAEVVTDLDQDLPPCSVLARPAEPGLLNIVVNAAHAIGDTTESGAGARGTITVSTRRDDDWVEIRISDTGAGIPEEIRSQIFDPFFTTKAVGKGTGQGLSIARSVIVDKHGGALRFESVAGEGTTFIIRLPLAGSVAIAA